MCGIAGVFGYTEWSTIQGMGHALVHRGPDSTGYYHDASSPLRLFHNRLSILDPGDQGLQPMRDSSGHVVLVYNGEIYNFRGLRDGLIQGGFKFRTGTDTEVLLNLYLRDGLDSLTQLNGIFAFALWDTRTATLLLARDAHGVKPLYYTLTNDLFAFASEIKALCHVPGLEHATDVVSLAQSLTFMYGPSPRTPCKNIHRVLPGEALLVKDGKIIRQWRYVKPPTISVREDLSEREASEGTVHFLSQATRRQMVSDVPLGSFLSGGLDSSSLAVFAREETGGRKLNCFTIGVKSDNPYKEGVVDDLPYATKVANHLGVDLHTVWVGSGMVSEFRRMIYHLDEPQADPAPINVSMICRMARQMGIKVLLSGAGGDDIFSGYRRHYALMQERWWTWLPKPLRGFLRASGSWLKQDSALGRRYRQAFQFADSPRDERLAGYFSWLGRDEVTSLFSAEFRDEAARHNPLQPMLDAMLELPENTHPLNRMLHLEQKFFLTDHNLNYTDKMSMAEGVEVRVPFLDPDLMAFASTLPPHFKQRGSCGKWILKKAMEPYLPKDVIYRSKTGFGAPMRTWMQHELKGYVDEMLSEATIRRRGLFDYKAVRSLVERDRLGQIDAAYPIFQLICIETWCQIFLDQHGVL